MSRKRKAMWLWQYEQLPPEKRVKRRTRFDDLPDEMLLRICRYLSPAHVFKTFDDYNTRLFSCIAQYRQKINLTHSSYADMKYFLSKISQNTLEPSTLTVSNAQIPIQIETFCNMCTTASNFTPSKIYHLSLLECKDNQNPYSTHSCLKRFQWLKSLHIVEAPLNGRHSSMNYAFVEQLRNLIFNNPFSMLTDLELSINYGLILDKQLPPKKDLQQLTISLHNVNDLYILLDGLVPNLTILNVTVCQSVIYKQLSLSKYWSHQYMSRLIEFQLITNETVEFTFDQLRNIVMPLNRLEKLKLYIRQWISNDQRVIDGHQLQMLFDQYIPQLHDFHCSINTNDDIDMQTFTNLNERWPIKCRSEPVHSSKHLYTIPWSFTHLHTSMLANDDTMSLCPNVQYLTVDVPCTNLSHRFPNIHTLTISNEYDLSQDNSMGFSHLRHLTVKNITIVPSSIIKQLRTLTVFETNELLTHSIVYSNIQHLNVKNSPIGSLPMINALVKHFPHLDSLEIQLEQNADYYIHLNVLLDNTHLPHLRILKTNWLDQETAYCSNINLWITTNTLLKWKSTPFYAQRNQNGLIIYL